MMRIVNTGELKTLWVTAALLPELRSKENVTIDETAVELKFSHADRLLPIF